ncbi:hypothetical protein C8F01DRAFT_1331574 [Mycena amicta]|nr:hypothetical protein C8F01DRAFT_1331574 [Mycena amicta]
MPDARSSNLQLITVPTSSSGPEPRAKSRSWALIRLDEAGAPGRTLGRLYAFIAVQIGSLVNSVARQHGKGPGADAEIILEFFRHAQWKEDSESVQELHSREQIPMQVLAACGRLVKYAFRSQTPRTQFAAFRNLALLSTQFPGLKTFFEESEHISSAIHPPTTTNSQQNLFRLWDRPDDSNCDSQWHFFCELAAACITDKAVYALIEGRAPAMLSSAVAHVSGLSFIEHLLNMSAYNPRVPFLSHLAIRYLGNILSLKPFWQQLHQELCVDALPEHTGGQLHSGIVDKLLQRSELLLQDLGVDSDQLEETTVPEKPLLLDEEGVDTYCQAILLGLQTSFLQQLPVPTSIVTELWYHSLRRVIHLLRREKSNGLLPKAREIALNETYTRHLPLRTEELEELAEVNLEFDRIKREGQSDVPSPPYTVIQDKRGESAQATPPNPQALIIEEVESPVMPVATELLPFTMATPLADELANNYSVPLPEPTATTSPSSPTATASLIYASHNSPLEIPKAFEKPRPLHGDARRCYYAQAIAIMADCIELTTSQQKTFDRLTFWNTALNHASAAYKAAVDMPVDLTVPGPFVAWEAAVKAAQAAYDQHLRQYLIASSDWELHMRIAHQTMERVVLLS